MAKVSSQSPAKTTSGVKAASVVSQRATPKGFGALKGKYVVSKDIDLTKPIYEQVKKKTK